MLSRHWRSGRENTGAMVCRPYGTCELRDAEAPTTEVVGNCLASLRDLEPCGLGYYVIALSALRKAEWSLVSPRE